MRGLVSAKWFGCVALALALLAPSVALAASPPDPPPWSTRAWIIDTAAAQDGKPYVWGANGPSSFDCSGLVSYCWQVSTYYGGSPRFTTAEYFNNGSGVGAIVSYDIPGTSVNRYSSCVRGDALVYRSDGEGHIVLFRHRNTDGSIQTWEARDPTWDCGSWSRSYSSLVNAENGGYKAIRRRNVNQPGAISMVAPTTPGTAVKAAGTITMRANAADEDGVDYVRFSKTGPLHLDTVERWYGMDYTAPYTWDLDTSSQAAGDYRMGAKVVDANAKVIHASRIDVGVVSHDRVAGATRFETAVAASQQKYPNGDAFSVVLVRGDDPADALSAAPLASYWNGPVLYTHRDWLPDATRNEIARIGPAQVFIVGGTAVISDLVMLQARDAAGWGKTATRVAGDDRFGTARRVRERMGRPQKTVLIQRDAVADAMAVSSGAAHRGYSILLCNTSSIPAETSAAIGDGATHVIVIGGTGTVDSVAWGQIPTSNDAGRSISKTRVWGANRYATAVTVANNGHFNLTGTRPHLVNGADESWPDGLCAGPLAGVNPTLLTMQTAAPVETQAELRRRAPSSIRLMGGAGVVGGCIW